MCLCKLDAMIHQENGTNSHFRKGVVNRNCALYEFIDLQRNLPQTLTLGGTRGKKHVNLFLQFLQNCMQSGETELMLTPHSQSF